MTNAVFWLSSGLLCLGETGESTASPAPPSEVADMDIEQLLSLRVSAFDVSSHMDDGYRASNSVSGSRFDMPIRDSPLAIQAFTQDFIEDQKPETIFDVARYSPSVTYRSNDFNEGNANLAIRGFAMGNAPGAVQLFRDGFYGPNILDFTNISRLEIVKGPSSFLYGQLAPGGVVNVITKTPQPIFGAVAKLRYGTYNAYRLDADVTGPIQRNLLFRVASSFEQDIHYWEPYDAHSADVAPTLLWQPNPWVTLTLKGEYFRKRESPQVMQKPGYGAQQGPVPTAADPNLDGVDVSGLPDRWNSMSFADFRHSDTASLNAIMDLKLNDNWGLRAGYAYVRNEIDAVASGNFGMSYANPFMQGRRVRRQNYTNADHSVQIDATGLYQLSFMSARLLLGVQYISGRFDNQAGQAANDATLAGPVASPLPNWDLRDPTTWNREASIPRSALTDNARDMTRYHRDQAAYLGTVFGFFGDRLLTLAGLRFTETSSHSIDRLTNQAGPDLLAHRLTPQAGVLYKLPVPVALFASYAESFIPGLEMLYDLAGPTEPERPTSGRGVDLGAKTDLWRGRLSGTLTFFEITNRNIPNDLAQLDPTTGRQVFIRQQTGEQRSRGIEVDATITPVDSWQTYLSYSYNDAKITEFSGRDRDILAAGPTTPGYRQVLLYHNAPLQMSAPHMGNLWTRFNVTRGKLRGWFVAGGVNLVFDQTLLPDTPASYHQTYALFSATLGFSPRLLWPRIPLTVELVGKNLSNEHYRPSQSSRSRPREFLLNVIARL